MSDTFNAVLPAEWAPQSGIQLTWPHAGTDWAHMLTEVQACFAAIAREIAQRELLLIVTPEPEEVKKQISATVNMQNVRFMGVKRMILGRVIMVQLPCWIQKALRFLISCSMAGG